MLEEERKQVLNMLAEGKITAEQATELLKALGDHARVENEAIDSAQAPEPVREAMRQARQATRDAREKVREEMRRASREVREAARSAGSAFDGGSLGSFIDSMVSSFTDFTPFGYRWDDVYEGNFTARTIDLNLATGNGSITLHTWTEPGYKLVMHLRAGGPDEAEARRRAADAIRVEHGGNAIKVYSGSGWWPRAYASIELWVPDGLEYHLKANSGNGSIKLEGGRYATARLHTGNGSIEGTAVIGDLEANTGNGSIRTAAAGSGRWNLTTGNGSIQVDTAGAGDSGIMVDANTGAGKILVDVGGQRMEQGGVGHVNVRISSPGYEQSAQQLSIRARTGLGSITVRPGA